MHKFKFVNYVLVHICILKELEHDVDGVLKRNAGLHAHSIETYDAELEILS